MLGASGSVLAAALLAGCSGDPGVYPAEDPAGDVHVDLKNCSGSDLDVSLSVSRVDGETVHDVTHAVPEGFCSDMGETYAVYELWEGDGDYRVRASVPSGSASFDRVLSVSGAGRTEDGVDQYEADLRLVAFEDAFDVRLGDDAEWVESTAATSADG